VLVAACFYYSGLVGLARWWREQRAPRQLIILNYHQATGGDLRRHLLYLRKHYRLLHLEEALDALYGPRQSPQADRRIPLVLTFDDGYQDNYTHALALARELQVPMTLFLIPGYLDSGAPFWWLEGARLARSTRVGEVTLGEETYRLEQPAARGALARAIDARLRHAGSVAEREAFLADICQRLAAPASGEHEEAATRPLTWDQVQEMQASGWVSFGAHTMHHPVLSYLRDPAEVAYEVAESRRVLEQRLGHPVSTFAYPIGKPEHFGAAGLRAVKGAGYRWAVTTVQRVNTGQADPHLVSRLPGEVSLHWLVMASQLVGLLGVMSRLRNAFTRPSSLNPAALPD
jgi:peptidoglycan/xylan/chitin deacetylase (PgdA/CDA1 family)